MAKAPNAPPDKLELYDAGLATIPDLHRKGAANAYTSLNGHMFSFIDKTGTMSLRLPTVQREASLSNFKTELSV